MYEGQYADSIGTHMLMKLQQDGTYQCERTSEKELNCDKLVLFPKAADEG